MTAVVSRVPGLQQSGTGRNTLWSAGGDVLALAATLVVFYLLTQELGPGGYGYYVAAQVLVAVLAMVSANAVGMLLMQEVVREGRPVQEVLATCLGLTLVTGTVGVLLAVPLGLLLLPGLDPLIVLLFAMAQCLGAGVLGLAGATEQAAGRYWQYVLVNASLHVLRLAGVLGLVAADRLTLRALAVTFCVLSSSAAAVALVFVQRRHGLALRVRAPRTSDVRRGLSYAGTLLSFAVQEDADKVLLVRLADPMVAGLYAAGYRGVQIATMPLRALVAASHRRFLEPADGRPGEHLRRAVRFAVPAAAYATVAMLGLLVAAPLVPRLLGSEYDGSETMFMLLAPLVLLRGLAQLPFNALMGLGRNDLRLAIVVVCAILSTGLCLTLIPLYSWTGAAIATLVSEAVFVVVTWLALIHSQRASDRAAAVGADGPAGSHAASTADPVALGTRA